jgi:hypothetical protein
MSRWNDLNKEYYRSWWNSSRHAMEAQFHHHTRKLEQNPYDSVSVELYKLGYDTYMNPYVAWRNSQPPANSDDTYSNSNKAAMNVTTVRMKELVRRCCWSSSLLLLSAWARQIDAGISSEAGYKDCNVASANTLQQAILSPKIRHIS